MTRDDWERMAMLILLMVCGFMAMALTLGVG
jgi:hypothetical protein